MGNSWPRSSINHNIEIAGSHNIAVMWNGADCNISAALRHLMHEANQQNRKELVWFHIFFMTSIVTITSLITLYLECLKYLQTSKTSNIYHMYRSSLSTFSLEFRLSSGEAEECGRFIVTARKPLFYSIHHRLKNRFGKFIYSKSLQEVIDLLANYPSSNISFLSVLA